MTWWCSARGVAWSWSWQAYPGVWVFILGLVVSYLWAITRASAVAGSTTHPSASRREFVLFFLGVFALWLALDWPIGALGAGYLLSVHQVQYVLLVMIAPPLLLLGTPAWLATWITNRRGLHSMMRFVTRPVAAILICNAIVVLTHLPAAVDGLMPTQLGSFVVDMAWSLGGLVLWWPVIRPLPEMNSMSYPARFGYLLAATLIPGIPALFYFFANYPIYALYELAPPVGVLSARDDQFLAGIIMKAGSFIVILLALSVLFFRWHRVDRSDDAGIVLPGAVTDL